MLRCERGRLFNGSAMPERVSQGENAPTAYTVECARGSVAHCPELPRDGPTYEIRLHQRLHEPRAR